MSATLPARTDFDPKVFWAGLVFWPNRFEQWAVRHWWIVLLVPYLMLVWWGGAVAPLVRVTRTEGYFLIVRDPYIVSLGAALLLSGLAFAMWQQTVRQTFAGFVETGVVPNRDDALRRFATHSRLLHSRLYRKRRYLVIMVFVAFALLANQTQLRWVVSGELHPDQIWYVRLFRFLTVLAFFGWAYGVGAVAWCLLSVARWIAAIPREMEVDVQRGHPDGCGGLRSIGTCCFQAIIPLLIGMVLGLAWSYSPRLPFFASKYNGDYFRTIVPVSRLLILVLLILAAALAILPLRGLHEMMRHVRLVREREYMQQLSDSLKDVEEALGSGDSVAIKEAAEKLSLTQQLDPASLRTSDWPFDYAIAVKYGIAPLISTVASFGKDVLKLLK